MGGGGWITRWEFFHVMAGALFHKSYVMMAKITPPELFYVIADPYLTHKDNGLAKCNLLARSGLHQNYVMNPKLLEKNWRVAGMESGHPELLGSPRTSPEVPQTSPEVFRRLPRNSSHYGTLTAIQRFPGSFLDFPGSSGDFPGGQPLSPGSLTPSPDSQSLPLININSTNFHGRSCSLIFRSRVGSLVSKKFPPPGSPPVLVPKSPRFSPGTLCKWIPKAPGSPPVPPRFSPGSPPRFSPGSPPVLPRFSPHSTPTAKISN